METLIERHCLALNERRFGDGAALAAGDAEIQHRPNLPLRGPAGYVTSAAMATTSFPDLRLEVLGITRRGDTVAEIRNGRITFSSLNYNLQDLFGASGPLT